ncbi:MAG: hypothetical protein ACK4PR_11310 [Gammaproteobacteria bacterium]
MAFDKKKEAIEEDELKTIELLASWGNYFQLNMIQGFIKKLEDLTLQNDSYTKYFKKIEQFYLRAPEICNAKNGQLIES